MRSSAYGQTNAERAFLAYVQAAAQQGVGFGWMQQVIEVVWQETLEAREGLKSGAWGPHYFTQEIQRLEAALTSQKGT